MHRRLVARLAAVLLLAATAGCFALPWLTVTLEERRGRGTGIELVRDRPSFTGHYVHASSEGEVEDAFENGSLWARIALVLVAVTLLLLLVPWPPATWAGAVVWAPTTLSLLAWSQAVTSEFVPPYVDRLAGFWLTLGLAASVIVPVVLLLREAERTSGGEWLDR
jgi:hypothetical protein